MQRHIIRLFLIGLAFPTLILITLLWLDVPIEAFGEPNTYINPTLRWMESGTFATYQPLVEKYLPYFQRQMGYPLLIALVFKGFGVGNLFAITLVQIVLAGMTVVFTALIAARINQSWFWPAGLLMAVCLNCAFRATTIMTETLFTFEILAGLAAFVWAIPEKLNARWQEKRTYILGGLAGFFFTSALLTRVAFLYFPFLVLIPIALVLSFYYKTAWQDLRRLYLPILAFMTLGISFQMGRAYYHYGVIGFTTESGHNLMAGLYPCLATKTGCGSRNPEALKKIRSQLTDAISAMSIEDKSNPFFVDQKIKEIALKDILELPKVSSAIALMGGYFKLLYHSSLYEFYERMGLSEKRIYMSQYTSKLSFLKDALASPWMLVWGFAQIMVLIFRGLQLVGCWCLIRQKETRLVGLTLLFAAIALVAVTAGVGNPRYRAPIEPIFLILSIAGLSQARILKKLGFGR